MALFKKKSPSWFMWLIVAIGLILAVGEMGFINLRGLTWGPVFLVLLGLWGILKQ